MIYDRKAVLGLKLRQSVGLKKLTRSELFSRLQLLRTVDPITNEAYREVEEEIWREQKEDSPHGHPWHVSFHASQFPGDDPMACPRQALYRMMDFPPTQPINRRLRALGAAGKAIEVELVRTWHEAGILISAAPDSPIQTGFQLPEAWLTGSVDAVLLPPRWNKPLPVEVKSKFQSVIDKMRVGAQGPDEEHVRQLKVQLALVRRNQEKLWPGLDPVTHGYIYYVSRDNPVDTAEFRVDLDEKFFETGLEVLKDWKSFFEEDRLPEINASKKHPMGWRWSYKPCLYCPFKKTCQLDFQAKRTTLSDSVGIDRAKLARPGYNPEVARKRVFDRWRK